MESTSLSAPCYMNTWWTTSHDQATQNNTSQAPAGAQRQGLKHEGGETLSQGLGIPTRSLSGDSSCSVQLILRNYNP